MPKSCTSSQINFHRCKYQYEKQYCPNSRPTYWCGRSDNEKCPYLEEDIALEELADSNAGVLRD